MASKWELVLWLLALPPSRSIVFKDQLFPYPAQHHSPHAMRPLPPELKMAGPLRGIKGGKNPNKLASQSPYRVPEISFTHFSFTFVRWRVWSWPGTWPTSQLSRLCFSLTDGTRSIFQDWLLSSQHSFNGMGLEKFELVLQSALWSFCLWQDGIFTLPRRWEQSVQKAEQESKRLT